MKNLRWRTISDKFLQKWILVISLNSYHATGITQESRTARDVKNTFINRPVEALHEPLGFTLDRTIKPRPVRKIKGFKEYFDTLYGTSTKQPLVSKSIYDLLKSQNVKDTLIADKEEKVKVSWVELDKNHRDTLMVMSAPDLDGDPFPFNLMIVIIAGVGAFLIAIICGKLIPKVIEVYRSCNIKERVSRLQTDTSTTALEHEREVTDSRRPPRIVIESVPLVMEHENIDDIQDNGSDNLSYIQQMSPAEISFTTAPCITPPPSYSQVIQLDHDPSLPTYEDATLDWV